MPDYVYFLCLAISAVCAVLAPVSITRLFKNRGILPTSIVAGFAVILGVACALPFGSTQELPWLPWLVLVYIGGTAMSAIFFGIGILAPPENRPAESGDAG